MNDSVAGLPGRSHCLWWALAFAVVEGGVSEMVGAGWNISGTAFLALYVPLRGIVVNVLGLDLYRLPHVTTPVLMTCVFVLVLTLEWLRPHHPRGTPYVSWMAVVFGALLLWETVYMLADPLPRYRLGSDWPLYLCFHIGALLGTLFYIETRRRGNGPAWFSEAFWFGAFMASLTILVPVWDSL